MWTQLLRHGEHTPRTPVSAERNATHFMYVIIGERVLVNGGGCGVSLVVKMFEIPKFRIRLVQLAVPVYDNNTYY